jgi:hypothetical protein
MGEWRYSSTILDLCTRWGWVVSFTPGPLYPGGKFPVSVGQEAGWASELVWTQRQIRLPFSRSVSKLKKQRLCFLGYYAYLLDLMYDIEDWGSTLLRNISKHVDDVGCTGHGRIWGSHSGGYEEYYLLGYKAIESQSTFRRNISPPSSAFHLLSCWFLAELILRPWRWRRYVPPKRRLTWTTRRYNPEDRTLYLWRIVWRARCRSTVNSETLVYSRCHATQQ